MRNIKFDVVNGVRVAMVAPAFLAAAFATPAFATPAMAGDMYTDTARVLSVTPQTERVNMPREECRTEYQQESYRDDRDHSIAGAVIGGIAGGLLGNTVGRGSGRVAATAVGAGVGAIAGDRIANDGRQYDQRQYSRYDDYPQEQAVRQCRMVDAYQTRTVGYDVTYDYRGRSYTSIMSRDPGDRVRLRVTVEPGEGDA